MQWLHVLATAEKNIEQVDHFEALMSRFSAMHSVIASCAAS